MGCGALFDLVTCRQTTFDFLLAPIQILPMREGFWSRKERNAHKNRGKLSQGNIGARFLALAIIKQAITLSLHEKFVRAYQMPITHQAEKGGLNSVRREVKQYKSR